MVLHLSMEMSCRYIIVCQLQSSHSSLVKTDPDRRTNVRAGGQFVVVTAFFVAIPVENFCYNFKFMFLAVLHDWLSKKGISWIPSHTNCACLCLAAANLLPRLLLDIFGKVFAVVHTMRSSSKEQLQCLKSTHTHRHQCHAKIFCSF